MLNAAWHMLKDRVEYKDLGADHFTRRDRSKAIRRLVRRNEVYNGRRHPAQELSLVAKGENALRL